MNAGDAGYREPLSFAQWTARSERTERYTDACWPSPPIAQFVDSASRVAAWQAGSERAETAAAAAARMREADEMTELTSEALEAAGLSRATRKALLRILAEAPAASERKLRSGARASSNATPPVEFSIAHAVHPTPYVSRVVSMANGSARSNSLLTGVCACDGHTRYPRSPAVASLRALPVVRTSHTPTHKKRPGCSQHAAPAAPLVARRGLATAVAWRSTAAAATHALRRWAHEAAALQRMRRAAEHILLARRRRAWGSWRCAQLASLFLSATAGAAPSAALAIALPPRRALAASTPAASPVDALLSDASAQSDDESSLDPSRARCAAALRRWHRRAARCLSLLRRTLAGWRVPARASLWRWRRAAELRLHRGSRALWAAERRCRHSARAALARWRRHAATRLRWRTRRMLLCRVWQAQMGRVVRAWWALVAAETRREDHLVAVAVRWDLAAARARCLRRLRRHRACALSRRAAGARHRQLQRRAALSDALERWSAPGRATRAFGALGVRVRLYRALRRWRTIIAWLAASRVLRRHARARLARRVWAGWRLWVRAYARYDRLLMPLRANKRKACRGLPVWMHSTPAGFLT